MAKYATLLDVSDDPALSVTDAHLDQADVYIDLSLAEKGFSADEIAAIVTPVAVLMVVAESWAKRLAAIDGAMGEQSPLIDKAKQFEKTATLLMSKITRETLGLPALDSAAAGFGFFEIGRA